MSLPLPSTPFERARGGGTPLGNPVLDELLPLQTLDPQGLAETLAGHEATGLAILHAWPLSEVEDGQLIWQATAAQVQAKGSNTEATLKQAKADLHSFQELFQAFQPQG